MLINQSDIYMIRCGSSNKNYDDTNLSSMLDYCAYIKKTSSSDIIYRFYTFTNELTKIYSSDKKPCWMNQKQFDMILPYHIEIEHISEPSVNDYGKLFVKYMENLNK